MDPSRSGRNNRLFTEAMLWIVRTGSPWRDLPAAFGNWSTAFRRFRGWREADIFKRIFDALSEEPDMEYATVDTTIVKVHRHGQGAKEGPEPGHRFDTIGVAPLINGIEFGALLANKTFGSNTLWPISTSAARKFSSRNIHVDQCLSKSTLRFTSGDT